MIERMRTILREESSFGWLLAVLAFPLAILRGIDKPGVWALTQATMNYSQGFAKRGLRGEVLQMLGFAHRAGLTRWMFLELFLFFLLVSCFVVKSGVAKKAGGSIVVAVLAGSFVVSALASLVGFTDPLLSALVICVLFLRGAEIRFTAAALLCTVCMLIHESFLLVYLPLVLFTFLLDACEAPYKVKRPLIYAGILGLLCLGLALLTSLHASLSPSQVAAWQKDLAARSDFTPDPFFAKILKFSIRQNIVYATSFALTQAHNFILNGFYYLPIAAYVGLLMHRLASFTNIPDRLKRVVLAAFYVVLVMPLSMVFLGTDLLRWVTASALLAFLALCVTAYRLPIRENRPSIVLYRASLALLVLELSLTRTTGVLAQFFNRIGL